MHYLFVDESYSGGQPPKAITMAGWIVEQARFNRYFSTSPNLHIPPVVDQINSMLETLDAWAVVGRADLDEKLFRAGEIDGTDDVSSMARTDNIWSQCFVFTVAALIAKSVREGKDVEGMDIHYDPKSLKVEHSSAIEATLRNQLVGIAKGYATQVAQRSAARAHLLTKLKIRRITPVTKPRTNTVLDKFQTGTWAADKLCSAYKIIQKRGFSRIIAKDMSEVVRRTVQQFKGRSYYA